MSVIRADGKPTTRSFREYFCPQFEPFPVLPSQMENAKELTGERLLVAEVIDQAVHEFVHSSSRRLAREAWAWINDYADNGTPWSWSWCCSFFGLDGKRARDSLAEQHAKQIEWAHARHEPKRRQGDLAEIVMREIDNTTGPVAIDTLVARNLGRRREIQGAVAALVKQRRIRCVAMSRRRIKFYTSTDRGREVAA